MAFGDTAADNARLLLRTIRGTADFSGRSRRTEVLYYVIACILVRVVLDFGFLMVLPFGAVAVVSGVISLLLLLPTFALFVRRVHDQDRSGRWVLMPLLAVILQIASVATKPEGDIQAMVAHAYSPLTLLSAAAGIAVLILYVLPGTDGPNRYGPDPRLEIDPTVIK